MTFPELKKTRLLAKRKKLKKAHKKQSNNITQYTVSHKDKYPPSNQGN